MKLELINTLFYIASIREESRGEQMGKKRRGERGEERRGDGREEKSNPELTY